MMKDKKEEKKDGTFWGWLVLLVVWLVIVWAAALSLGHFLDRLFNGRGY